MNGCFNGLLSGTRTVQAIKQAWRVRGISDSTSRKTLH